MIAFVLVRRLVDLGDVQEAATHGEFLGAMAVGQESIVPDTLKAVGQHVEEKAPDELVGIQGHGPVHAARLVVSVGEGDVAVLHADKAMVGNGDAVGVAGQVIEDGVGVGKRRFGIDDPFGLATVVQELLKSIPFGESC